MLGGSIGIAGGNVAGQRTVRGLSNMEQPHWVSVFNGRGTLQEMCVVIHCQRALSEGKALETWLWSAVLSPGFSMKSADLSQTAEDHTTLVNTL